MKRVPRLRCEFYLVPLNQIIETWKQRFESKDQIYLDLQSLMSGIKELI